MNIFLIISFVIGNSAIVLENDSERFKDIKWGSSLSELSNMEHSRSEYITPILEPVQYYIKSDDNLNYLGINVDKIEYGYWRDKLYKVEINAEGRSNWEEYETALTEQLGKPRRPHGPNKLLTWKLKETFASMNPSFDSEKNLTHVLVVLTSREIWDEINKSIKAQYIFSEVEPDGFRDIKWGTLISDIKNNELVKDSYSGEISEYYISMHENLYFMGVKVDNIRYRFWRNNDGIEKLDHVEIKAKGVTNWLALKKALYEKFASGRTASAGKPLHHTYGDSWQGRKTQISSRYNQKTTDIALNFHGIGELYDEKTRVQRKDKQKTEKLIESFKKIEPEGFNGIKWGTNLRNWTRNTLERQNQIG